MNPLDLHQLHTRRQMLKLGAMGMGALGFANIAAPLMGAMGPSGSVPLERHPPTHPLQTHRQAGDLHVHVRRSLPYRYVRLPSGITEIPWAGIARQYPQRPAHHWDDLRSVFLPLRGPDV